MTSLAIILIVVSAFAHAFWNLLGKRQNPSAAFFLLTTIPPLIFLLPVLLVHRRVLPLVPRATWWLVLATGVCQAVYFTGLAGAYRRGDMSLAYPLARSVPIFLIAGLNLALGRGDQIGGWGLVGMFAVAMGCLVLPLPGFRHIRLGHYVRGPCLPALLAALGTSGYTMIDDEALRQLRGVQNAGLSNVELTLLYAALQTISTSLALAGYVILNGSERRRLAETWRTALGGATLTGLIITVTYGLVLVSMAHVANVSYVAAFRQLSIPLGAILGIVVQKEPCPVPKWVGIIIISVGMVLVGVG